MASEFFYTNDADNSIENNESDPKMMSSEIFEHDMDHAIQNNESPVSSPEKLISPVSSPEKPKPIEISRVTINNFGEHIKKPDTLLALKGVQNEVLHNSIPRGKKSNLTFFVKRTNFRHGTFALLR